MARNKFKAAINHIKSTRIDEKIQRLNEAPTNNMSGVYDLSPRGQRYGELDPEKIFYANLDGSWPPGVPGTPGERKYIRPRGYWEEGPGTVPSVQHDEIIELDFSYDTQTDDPRNTKTLIDETTGRVKTELPPNSRSFILGPLVDLYFHNHGNDNRTYVGYIQKDTREFVLLGYVHGRWGNDNNGDPIRSDGFETGSARVWNGQESGFVASNPSFTFEMLQWHHERLKEGKYVKNVSFFNSGGVPIVTGGGGTGQPSGSTQGNASGTPGPGDAGNNGDADQSYGSGGNPNIGNPQNAPQGGNQNDAGGPFPDPPKPPPEDRPTPPPPEDRDDRDDRDDSLVSLFNAMKRGYQARWEAANYQAAAITGGILIGLSIKEFVAGLAVILGAVGVSDQIKRRQMGQYYHNAINGLTMQSNSDRSESDLSDAEWERQAERGRQQDAKNLEDANEKYRDAEAELSSAEASGNEEAIARAQEKVENAQKNRERVINNNTRNRQQRSKERRNRGLTQQGGQGREKGATINDRPFGESFIITESHKRILREIKQPVAEISELKPEKLKKYRPNFKGRFTAQNTPDVTASKESDKMVRAKNAAGQTWRTSDKYWGGYESQERLNVIYDHVGHGNLYWDEIVAHNQSKKGVRDRDIQEELNKHYAVLAERKMMDELGLNEQETLEAPNDPLLKRVMGKLKPQIDYPDKPSPMGYPNKPPRQRPDGYPSDYGMRDNYYNKLDQISADSMPPTGNELIDRKVDAQKTPLKKKSKKEIKAEARLIQSNWREETQLQESDWTPVAGSIANSTGTTFEYPGGSRVTVSGLGGVETTPSTVTVNQFGDIFDVPGPNYSQLGLQGYAPPLGNVNRRRDYEDVNPRLDASQEFAQNVNSDVFMNARVQSGEFTPKQQAAIDAWNDELRSTMDRHGAEWEAVLKKDGGYDPEKHKGLQARHGAEMDAIWSKEPKFDVPPDPSVPLDYDPFKGVDAPDPSVPLDYNPPESKVDPYADRILELNVALDKMKEKGTLISHYKIIGPGEEGYVDTTNMANAIGYNRKPIYTSPAQEMFAELEKLYALQLAWLEKQNSGGEVLGADDALDDYNRSMGPNSEPPSDTPEDPNESVPTPDDDLLDQLAKMFGVGSAKNFLDHYADNFVKGDGKQDQNLTNLLSKNDRNWLKNALAGDSAITNPKRFDNPQDAFSQLMQRAPRGIRNSIGNGAKLDMDYYNRTGDFKIDKSYVFTEPRDFEVRTGNRFTSNIGSIGTVGYARTKAGGNPLANASRFINNPMRFHVVIPGPKNKKKKVNESTWSKLKKYR